MTIEPFSAVDVIAAKRDKHILTDAQIDWVVDAYTRGVVADEQMSALAMAILLNGMTSAEIARWTNAMRSSRPTASMARHWRAACRCASCWPRCSASSKAAAVAGACYRRGSSEHECRQCAGLAECVHECFSMDL